MNQPSVQLRDDGAMRSIAIKAIRRLRGLSTGAVASGMNIPLRTYERFERGEGRVNHDYVHRFCAVTDSDPHAFMTSIAIGSPMFAARAADNKFMTLLAIHLQASDRRLGDRLRSLDARTLISVFGEMFDRLADAVDTAEAAAAFLESGRRDLSNGRPRPGR